MKNPLVNKLFVIIHCVYCRKYRVSGVWRHITETERKNLITMEGKYDLKHETCPDCKKRGL